MDSRAGFDIAIELTAEALRTLMPAQVAGLSLTGPTDLNRELAPMTLGPSQVDPVAFHAVVRGIDIAVEAPAGIKLTAHLERLSLSPSPVLPAGVSRLAGDVVVHVPLRLAADGTRPTGRVIEAVMRSARVDPVQLRRPDGTVDILVSAGVNGYITNQLRAEPTYTAPLPVTVDPAATPSLQPLVVKELAIGVANDPTPARRTLLILANALRLGAGDPNGLTYSAMPAGRDVTVRVSPDAFHTLVFVPAVQQALRVTDPMLLPATCGRSESVPAPTLPEWSVTRVADTLGHGQVDVVMQLREHGGDDWTGNTLIVDVHGHLTFPVSSGGVAPLWTTDSASGGQTFGPGLWLLGVVVPPFLGLLGTSAALVAGATSGNSSAFAPSLPAIAATLPVGNLVEVQVSPDSFTLVGTVPHRVFADPSPRLRVQAVTGPVGDVVTTDGVYHSTGCPVGDFSWTARTAAQQATFTLLPEYAAFPLHDVRWTVSGIDLWTDPLTAGGSGELQIPVTVDLPAPPPGGSEIRTCVLRWAVADDGTLTLTSSPDDGNFQVNVAVEATDAAGARLRASGYAQIEGVALEFGDGWQQAIDDCARGLRGRLGGLGRLPVGGFQGSGPLPDPAELVAIATAAVRGDKEAALTLRHLQLLHGSALSVARIDQRVAAELPVVPRLTVPIPPQKGHLPGPVTHL